jgi:hypothetical protein
MLKTKIIIISIIVISTMLLTSCKDPLPRPGNSFDGSARWAYNLANPEIQNFSGDAILYVIMGAVVYKDGRLPSNTGTWSFIAYSQSRGEEIQVTVNWKGEISKDIHARTEPPGRGEPLPSNWINSNNIFQIAYQHVNDSPDAVTYLTVNWTEYPQAPGKALWALAYFNPGGTHLVTIDGQYIGTP